MSCELPERNEWAYPEPTSHDLGLCLSGIWDNYHDSRRDCELNNTMTCAQKLACEAQAWADYLLFRQSCIDQHGSS